MAKNYYIANINDTDTNSDIFYTLLIILCVLAIVVFICNYYFSTV